MIKISFSKLLSVSLIVALMVFLFPALPSNQFVKAAGLTNLKDTLSTLEDSGAGDIPADHTLEWDAVSGIASGETIVITMPSDFDGTTDALDFNDVDLLIDTVADQTCDGTPADLVASGATSSQWNVVFSGTENRVLTITSGGASATVSAGDEICIQIGENATGGAGNSQYQNPTTTGAKDITVTSGSSDSGTIQINIIDDSSVDVSATVDPTITFSINDTAVGFGTLTTANARFANEAGTGTAGPSSASDITMAVATNASTGWNLTYNGATLTNGASDTISIATIAGDEDGAPNSEQFALGITTNGNATIATGYRQATADFEYKFVIDTTVVLISETAPTATETITVFYLANIAGTTEAGSYTTAITYVATANF